jgi:hypothetical protein
MLLCIMNFLFINLCKNNINLNFDISILYNCFIKIPLVNNEYK